MGYATLTEAWGNYNPHENFSNQTESESDSDYYEGFSNPNPREDFWNQQPSITKQQNLSTSRSQKPKKRVPKKQIKVTQPIVEPKPNIVENNDMINKEIENLKLEISQLKELIRNQNNLVAGKSISFNRNIHDIILFIIFGLFIILTLDGIFKLACKANKKYLVI